MKDVRLEQWEWKYVGEQLRNKSLRIISSELSKYGFTSSVENKPKLTQYVYERKSSNRFIDVHLRGK